MRSIPHKRSRRGFTLVEVMLALAIMVLLVGGLFGTVRATLQSTVELREAQRTQQTVYGLFELCRRTFPTLPAAATITWLPGKDPSAALPEVDLLNAPQAFSVGGSALFSGEIALTCRRESGGDITVGVEYRRIDSQTGKVLPDPLWLPLVREAKQIRWSFFDGTTGQWQDGWNDPARHPALIRLSLGFPGDDRVWTQIFWLPPLAVPKLPPPKTAADGAAPIPTS